MLRYLIMVLVVFLSMCRGDRRPADNVLLEDNNANAVAPADDEAPVIATSLLLAQENEYLEFVFCNSVNKTCGPKHLSYDDKDTIVATDTYNVVFARSCVYEKGCHEWYWRSVGIADPDKAESVEDIEAASHRLANQEAFALAQTQDPTAWLNSLEKDDRAALASAGVAGVAIVFGAIAVPTYPVVEGAVRYLSYFRWKWSFGGGKEAYAKMLVTNLKDIPELTVDAKTKIITAWDWDKTLTMKSTIPFMESTFKLKQGALEALTTLIDNDIDVVIVSQNNSKKMPEFLKRNLLAQRPGDPEWAKKVAKYFTVLQPSQAGMGNKDEMLAKFVKGRMGQTDVIGKAVKVVGFDDNKVQVESMVEASKVDPDFKLKNVEFMGYRVPQVGEFNDHFKFAQKLAGKPGAKFQFMPNRIYEPPVPKVKVAPTIRIR